jgi:hypothetical protein
MIAPARSLVNPTPTDLPPPAVVMPLALAAFPADLRFALTTTADLEDDVKIDRATDGTGRARAFYLNPKQKISAALTAITQLEWEEFDAFYRAYRVQSFTVPWGPCDAPVALPVLFASPPSRKFLGGGLSSVTFSLVEFP